MPTSTVRSSSATSRAANVDFARRRRAGDAQDPPPGSRLQRGRAGEQFGQLGHAEANGDEATSEPSGSG